MTRAVRTAQFGCSSLRTSATYKESREARLSLIPYRTRKSENGESRWVDSVCAGIDSRKSVHPIRSKERNAVELVYRLLNPLSFPAFPTPTCGETERIWVIVRVDPSPITRPPTNGFPGRKEPPDAPLQARLGRESAGRGYKAGRFIYVGKVAHSARALGQVSYVIRYLGLPLRFFENIEEFCPRGFQLHDQEIQ